MEPGRVAPLVFSYIVQFERNPRGAAFGYGAGGEWPKNHVRMSVDVNLIVPLFLSSGYTWRYQRYGSPQHPYSRCSTSNHLLTRMGVYRMDFQVTIN